MNAALVKIGPVFTSKRGQKRGRLCQLYVFEDLDTNKTYKMNLPINERVAVDWLNTNAREGDIFVGISTMKQWPKNIDFNQGFTTFKRKVKEEQDEN